MSTLQKHTQKLVAGIDIGGTRTKCGLINSSDGSLLDMKVFPTEHVSEQRFFDDIATVLSSFNRSTRDVRAAGVSIGSYVFSDGSIDGLSSMVPFLTHGYPLKTKFEEALGMPVQIDNDARLIGLAEALYGEGKGFSRVLTITIGTGIGIGLCEDGKPYGKESHIHLAGHIRVREGGEYPWLDSTPCYCNMTGCLESTCSGTALLAHIHHEISEELTVEDMFTLARQGNNRALSLVNWYLKLLARALNQYVYLYCPDVIVLGGGVAQGLRPYLDSLRSQLVASVYEGQKTELRITKLKESSGVIGAASLVKI
ncbi:ROK family protein [Olegusella massiliensis]|uniref:ROK family protein n=1 Tax=Olegusella massiliensis TaxID=1776381 RepID=UPI0008395482|nr:ROK family protein [Olegusella massiliensis]